MPNRTIRTESAHENWNYSLNKNFASLNEIFVLTSSKTGTGWGNDAKAYYHVKQTGN